ncbi:hypothetical protein FZW96_17180 [Bacillus sp. BGMRC 2118]|nr:hypothetical protein FZW96_17180 [Bacillus sp. BGMRC 2118]
MKKIAILVLILALFCIPIIITQTLFYFPAKFSYFEAQIGPGDLTGYTATIIGGFLSLLGGIFGAVGAYLVAKFNMDEQLNRQYRKEYEKIIIEMYINKYQEMLIILNDCKRLLAEWRNNELFWVDARLRILFNNNEKIDKIRLLELIESAPKIHMKYGSDYYINVTRTYNELNTYKNFIDANYYENNINTALIDIKIEYISIFLTLKEFPNEINIEMWEEEYNKVLDLVSKTFEIFIKNEVYFEMEQMKLLKMPEENKENKSLVNILKELKDEFLSSKR